MSSVLCEVSPHRSKSGSLTCPAEMGLRKLRTVDALDPSRSTGCLLLLTSTESAFFGSAQGPLIAGHVLVLPIEHHPSLVALPPEVYDEMMQYKEALQKCFSAQGRATICFERYLQLRAGTHAHLQVRLWPGG